MPSDTPGSLGTAFARRAAGPRTRTEGAGSASAESAPTAAPGVAPRLRFALAATGSGACEIGTIGPPAPSELGLVVSVMLRRSALELRGTEEGGEKPVAFAIAQ